MLTLTFDKFNLFEPKIKTLQNSGGRGDLFFKQAKINSVLVFY